MSLLRDQLASEDSAELDAASTPELEDEREFLLRSLADLDAERGAGDISAADYAVLRDRYTVRAATVARVLRARAVAPTRTPAKERPDGQEEPRRRSRKLVWAALSMFAAAALALVTSEVVARLPGQPATGSVRLNPAQSERQSLAQAEALEQQGNGAAALSLYRQILQRDPTQEQALAESGWLEFEAGVSAKNTSLLATGQRDVQAAERLAPADYAPHLYLASMALVEGDSATAVSEYGLFLADNPPTTVAQSAWPYIVRASEQAGRTPPVPPAGVHG